MWGNIDAKRTSKVMIFDQNWSSGSPTLINCLRSANPADPLEYCDIWKLADTWSIFWIRFMACEIYVFSWKTKPNKLQKQSKLKLKWPQNDTKWVPKSYFWRSGCTFEGLGRPLHFFLLFLDPFWGPFLGYFGVKKLEKTIIISLNKCNGERNRYEAKK